MRFSMAALMIGLGSAAPPAIAQSLQPPANTIVVAARATVETPPDTAILTLTARGEGKTPDDATRALAAKLKAITGGLRAIDPAIEIQTNSVAIGEAYAGECNRDGALPLSLDTQLDMAADALSAEADRVANGRGAKPPGKVADPCAIIGYIARSDARIKMRKVADAGTAVGLASRLGAASAGLESFDLAKDDDARTRATAAAIATARRQAQAIASGSGVKLGSIVSVVDGSSQGDTVMAMEMRSVSLDTMTAGAPEPVPVDISPKPVTTGAQLIVTFAVSR